jgi:hypothetical protein
VVSGAARVTAVVRYLDWLHGSTVIEVIGPSSASRDTMEAGIANHVWSIEEIVALLE